MKINLRQLTIASLFFLLLNSCSIQKIALNTTSGLFEYGIEALYAEPDLQIAETAITANLKLIEGFHRADPKNKTILDMLTQGYSGLALAFLEDSAPDRASRIYLRARDYGLLRLQQTKAFKNGIPVKESDFVARLPMLEKKDLPTLFWTAFAWAGWVNLNRNDPQAVFDLSKVKAMMTRVLELDETFFFGSAHLFWGSTLGSIPPMLGGSPEKAKEHFEKALAISDGKFLITKVYYAQFYATTTLDEELFDRMLSEVLEAPEDVLPGYELLTAVAKRKAADLQSRKDDIL
ncbi:MAG: TRAP transporter TatT component family protein [Calditrichia bacterium]